MKKDPLRALRLFGGIAGLTSLLVASPVVADDYSTLYEFSGRAGNPNSPIVRGSDGKFYGTAGSGGSHGLGCVYQLSPDGLGGYSYAEIYELALESDGADFRGPLVEGADGLLYGTAYFGGADDDGILFRVSKAGVFESLLSFDGVNGAQPNGLILGTDGSFYGTTTTGGPNQFGTVFRFDPPGTLTTLHGFSNSDGGNPSGTVLEAADGNLYGLTSSGGPGIAGTVYRLTLGGTLTTLHSFSYTDGSWPLGELVAGADGNLYGVTTAGGSGSLGVIFRVDSGGVVTTVRTFEGFDEVGGGPHTGLLEASDGNLYGTTGLGGSAGRGTLYRLDGAGTAMAIASFSASVGTFVVAPLAELVTGHLLGAALDDGDGDYGTLFDCTFAGNMSLVRAFHGSPEGSSPAAGVVEGAPGVFFGTAQYAGMHGQGTIFRVDGPGTATALHAFDGSDGGLTVASLTFGTDGRLYGTSLSGNIGVGGSVFAIDELGTFQLIHAFLGQTAFGPYAGLLSASDGNLYGLASFGGAFRATTAGDFTLLDGGPDYAYGTLIESNGTFLGTTASGGAFTAGTIFSMDSSGSVTTLYDFPGPPNGAFYPVAGLVKGSDGAFYGTTKMGGVNGNGTVFRMDAAGTVRVIHDFGNEAMSPSASLVQAPDGFLYGTTDQVGPSFPGIVFRTDFSGTGFSVLHVFSGSRGVGSQGALILASDGSLVGTTVGGGSLNGGTVFRLGLPPSTFAVTGTLPSSGPASGGAGVGVAGSAFVNGATASIGGADATAISFINPTELSGITPALVPGTLNDVTVTLPDTSTATLPAGFLADFTDVSGADIFHDAVETIFRDGITAGCGGGAYCRNDPATRAQMAVFLLKAKDGAAYVPPACQGVFSDVPCPGPFTDWIEDLAARQITAGCGGGNYCPASPVTRQQMAVFLLKTAYGSSFAPPPCSGVFGDVACPGSFSDWVELLYGLHVTGGCSASPLLYCPTAAVTRGQMSAFLTKMFFLP